MEGIIWEMTSLEFEDSLSAAKYRSFKSLGLPEDFRSVAKRGGDGNLAIERHLFCLSIKST